VHASRRSVLALDSMIRRSRVVACRCQRTGSLLVRPAGINRRAIKSANAACALDAACQPCIVNLSKSSSHSRSRVLLLGLDRLGCTFPSGKHLIQGSVARALRPNHLSPKCSQRFRRPHLSITTTSRFLGLRRCVEPLSSAARRTRPSSTASATV
jgi:hypothetical protein